MGEKAPLETIVAFPAPRDQIPLASSFRSTWLGSSLRSLRQRELLGAYFSLLPPEYHDAVRHSVAGVWLPIGVAEAHYAACDALKLPAREVFEIGREATDHVNASLLAVALKLAKAGGATPWTFLAQHQRIWERVWVGGAAAVYKAGPKDGIVEIAGWSCARYAYTRIAFRGVLSRLSAFFSSVVYVSEIPKLCDATGLGYRVAWA